MALGARATALPPD